jgi:hypothetical protein
VTYRLLPSDVDVDRTTVAVVRYYDRSTRCWWGYPVNAAGDQLGDAVADHFKDCIPMDPAKYDLWK